jgi:hypothetical protein
MCRKALLILSSIVVMGLCLLFSSVDATMVEKLSDEELSNRAETILIGKCTSIRSEWNEEHTAIFTYVTISPQEFLKGSGNSQPIVVKKLGGEVDGIGMAVDETPVFEEGEEVLVFLRKGDNGFHTILGLYQGKFSVKTDEATGRKILLREKVRTIRDEDGRLRKVIVPRESDRKLFLNEFVSRIHSILQEKKK